MVDSFECLEYCGRLRTGTPQRTNILADTISKILTKLQFTARCIKSLNTAS